MSDESWNSIFQNFESAMMKGQYPQALAFIKKLEQLANQENQSSYKIKTQYAYGDFYMKQQQYQKAIYSYQKGTKQAENEALIQEHIMGLEKMSHVSNLNQEYQQSQNHLETALELAEENNLTQDRNRILGALGTHRIIRHDYENAELSFSKMYAIAEGESNDFLRMKSLSGMGKIFFAKGETDKAFDYFRQAERIAQTLDDKFELSVLQGNQAAIMAQKFQYEAAIDQYLLTLPNLKSLDYERGVIIALINLSILHTYLMQYDKAFEYLEQARESIKQHHEALIEELFLKSQAQIYFDLEDYPKSLDSINQALELCAKTGVKKSKITNLLTRGSIYCFLKKWDLAEIDFTNAYNEGFSKEDLTAQIRGLGGKGCIMIQKGNADEGISLVNQALSFSDAVIYSDAVAVTAELAGFICNLNGLKEHAIDYYTKAMEYYGVVRWGAGIKRCRSFLEAQGHL